MSTEQPPPPDMPPYLTQPPPGVPPYLTQSLPGVPPYLTQSPPGVPPYLTQTPPGTPPYLTQSPPGTPPYLTQPAVVPSQAGNTLSIIAFLASLYAPFGSVLSQFTRIFPQSISFIGFFGLLTLPAIIIAIVLGHIALSQSKRYIPAKAYRGLAITALVLGYVEIAFLVLVLGAIILIFSVTRIG